MKYYTDKKYLISLVVGFVALFASFFINSYAVSYANTHISNPVTDIVLSNIPVFNVDGIFVYGAVLFVLVIIIICLIKPRHSPFVLKSIALFTIIRSFFISLTHISPFPTQVAITPNFFTTSELFKTFFTGNDLFFSGHTGLPFLLALIFWEYPVIRYIFLGFSVLFGVVVLLGHLHYSIDVASAFFITFSIFCIAKTFFKSDWRRSQNEE